MSEKNRISETVMAKAEAVTKFMYEDEEFRKSFFEARKKGDMLRARILLEKKQKEAIEKGLMTEGEAELARYLLLREP